MPSRSRLGIDTRILTTFSLGALTAVHGWVDLRGDLLDLCAELLLNAEEVEAVLVCDEVSRDTEMSEMSRAPNYLPMRVPGYTNLKIGSVSLSLSSVLHIYTSTASCERDTGLLKKNTKDAFQSQLVICNLQFATCESRALVPQSLCCIIHVFSQ